MPAPESVDIAMVRMQGDELRPVIEVVVDTREQYPKLLGVKLGENEAGLDEIVDGQVKPSADSEADPIPF